MIVTCPACAARYQVADQEFAGGPGRNVRCANCGHQWFETPSIPSSPGEEAGPASASRTDNPADDLAAAPSLSANPERRVSPPAIRRAKGRVAPWLAAVAVIVIAAVAAIIITHRSSAPSPVMSAPNAVASAPGATATAPGPAAFSAARGKGEPNLPAANGLVIRKIAPSRSGGGLVIAGEIANLSGTARKVPRLRLALEDAKEQELRAEIVEPPKAQLGPGESVQFQTAIADPPGNATGVVVTFAPS
jgi:predicted Zn finger-like uncharacterized protein